MRLAHRRKTKLFFGTLILLAAILAIYFKSIANAPLFTVLKPLTTILILLFAVLFGIKKSKFHKWMVIGLCFCLVGDTLLLEDSYFAFGLAAFLLAHLCFSYGFTCLGGFKKYMFPLFLLGVFGLGYYWILFDALNALKVPVLLYFLVILFMAWQGIGLRIWKATRPHTLIALGVLLFIISDGMLAWAKFKEPFPLDGILILATYWTSIFLLVLSATLEGVVPRSKAII